MSSLGQLVAGVAHELNNPIGFVHANLQLLDEYVREARRRAAQRRRHASARARRSRSCSSRSREGTERVKKIVQDLRTFSRMDQAELQEVDLHEEIDRTLGADGAALQERRSRWSATTATLPRVRCYAGQLNQVFLNLLMNACDAIDGKGTIRIRTRARTPSGVRLEFHDDGPGISPEIREPHLRAVLHHQAGGPGHRPRPLDLARHRRAPRRPHAGSSPSRAQGATFVIELPLVAKPPRRLDEEPPRRRSACGAVSARRGRSPGRCSPWCFAVRATAASARARLHAAAAAPRAPAASWSSPGSPTRRAARACDAGDELLADRRRSVSTMGPRRRLARISRRASRRSSEFETRDGARSTVALLPVPDAGRRPAPAAADLRRPRSWSASPFLGAGRRSSGGCGRDRDESVGLRALLLGRSAMQLFSAFDTYDRRSATSAAAINFFLLAAGLPPVHDLSRSSRAGSRARRWLRGRCSTARRRGRAADRLARGSLRRVLRSSRCRLRLRHGWSRRGGRRRRWPRERRRAPRRRTTSRAPT